MSDDKNGVVYAAVPGYLSYRVGIDGSVWSSKPLNGIVSAVVVLPWRRLSPFPNNGYPSVKLCSESFVKTTFAVHKLVLLAFVGPCPDGMQCLHGDDNPLNNALWNLRWGTPKENHADAIRNGRKSRGSNHHLAKLDESKAKEIKGLISEGGSNRKIARQFGVASCTIQDIRSNKTWRHV